jgi:hypothetical protein
MEDLEDYSGAPPEARIVDDIWINGHLAKLGIKRFIIPIGDVSINVPKSKSAVEETLSKHSSSRSEANSIMLKYFGEYFKKENILYEFGGVNGPQWASSFYLFVYVPLRERWLEYWVK